MEKSATASTILIFIVYLCMNEQTIKIEKHDEN